MKSHGLRHSKAVLAGLRGSPGVQARKRISAAAPELLAALQAILHPANEAIVYFVPSDAHAQKLREDAIAAVAKAVGC